jgi:hypothetical protein
MIQLFGNSASCSHANFRRVPDAVSIWPDFVYDLLHSEYQPVDGLARPMLTPPSIENSFVAANEADLEHAFIFAAGSALDNVLRHSRIRTTLFPRLQLRHGYGLSVPDFASAECSENGQVKLWAVGEVKRKALIMHGEDLTSAYHTSEYVRDAIWQLCGYQVIFRRQYGFLTCYSHTWATCLQQDGTLLVSPAFSSGTSGPLSVLRMMFHIINLASANAPWIPPRLPTV